MLGGVLTPAQLENARDILRHTGHVKALRDGATASDLLSADGHAGRGHAQEPLWPIAANGRAAPRLDQFTTEGTEITEISVPSVSPW